MGRIDWQQFGLKKDPYDESPLTEGGDLPIEDVFVDRQEEQEFLNDLCDAGERLCITICGDPGVGKTSLANRHKFFWKNRHTPKRLFSFRREIDISLLLLNKQTFLIEIIGSVLRELQLLQPGLLKEDLLQKLTSIVDISQAISLAGGGLSFAGFGADVNIEKSRLQPIQLAVTILERYFDLLLAFIKENEIDKKRYDGLIVHVNNFDTVLTDASQRKQVRNFFQEVRDILQTKGVYFLFLGPRDFFQDIIAPVQRVKSIFHAPLFLKPLSKTDIVRAFDERMELLQSEDIVRYIKPVEDEVVFRLYDVYGGDMRLIMSGLRAALNQFAGKIARSLSLDEALFLLGQELLDEIEKRMQPTPQQKQILYYFMESQGSISQKEVAMRFHKAPANVSGYYLRPFREACVIEEKSKEGRTPLWDFTREYMPLKFLKESQRKLKEDVVIQSQQLKLFS